MFVFYLSICCSSTKDKTGQSAKAFLHQFLCSHIFLFCLFYLPSTTILPSSQCPATRQHRFIFASVSIHLYVRTYTRLQYCISTYTYIYVRTYTRLTYRISTQCLQCGATRAGDQAVRQLTAFKSVSPTGLKASSQATAKSETGKLTCWRHPALRLNFPSFKIFSPAPPAKCDGKSSIELEVVGGYLNINIPIMESGAGPAARKVSRSLQCRTHAA